MRTLFNEKTESSAKRFILYACDVCNDGVGDAQHLIDFVDAHKKNPVFHDHDPLIILSFSPSNQEKIEKMLQDCKSINKKNVHLICHNFDDAAEIFDKYFKNNHELLSSQLKKTDGMFNISTGDYNLHSSNPSVVGEAFDKYLKAQSIQFGCISIYEHAGLHNGALTHTPPNVSLGIDEAPGYVGFKIQDFPAQAPSESLYQIEDKRFLATLLGKSIPDEKSEIKISEDECKSFIANSLFIPSYHQDCDGRGTLDQIIRGVTSSPLARDYKEIVFQGGINNYILQSYRRALPPEISTLTIVKKVGKSVTSEVLTNPASTSGKAVKIIDGFHLDKSDYQRTLAAAQLFHLVSGDNTLEQALSYNKIPIYDIKIWKLDFLVAFQKYAAALGKQHVCLFLDPIITNGVDKEHQEKRVTDFAKALNSDLLTQWQEVLVDLRAHHNVYTKMPELAAQLLEQSCSLKKSSLPAEEVKSKNFTPTSGS